MQSTITNPPQNTNTSRNERLMAIRNVQERSRRFRSNLNFMINGLCPLMNHGRNPVPYTITSRSWLRRPYQSDQTTRPNSSNSFIINLENINEPSCSFFDSNNLNRNIPSHIQVDFSPSDAIEGNAHESINQNQENNNNNIMTQTFAVNNNNNNNNNNISTAPVNEGVQDENSNFAPTTENQSLDKLLNKYLPFITFLLMKAMYDYKEGILMFVGLLVTFIHANSVTKREIAKQSHRSLLSLGILFVNLFVCICFIYFVFREQHLYNNLIFIPPYSHPLNISDLLWIVGITDFVLKFITIQLKVGLACFPAKLLSYSARGKWYFMLESTSQLYRGLVPIQPWLYYLMETYQGSRNLLMFFFTVGYMVSKGSDLMSKIKLFLKAFWKLLKNENLGVHPTKEELNTIGTQCPICHDDYNTPLMLSCRHVFCESCVMTWFDREQTCPLCRAKIADDPSWRDGATSYFVQLF